MRWEKAKQLAKNNTVSLFDQAEKQKQDGINLSYSHADSYWKNAVKEVLRDICVRQSEFTTDLVWTELADKGVHTGEPRALGAIIQGAHRSGMIKPTGKYVPSYRRHKSPIILWQSMIYKPTQASR